MSAKDVIITVTVDTEKINKSNVNETIVFTDNLSDPLSFVGHPDKFVSFIEKGQTLVWQAVAKNGDAPVYIQNVKQDGGSKIIEHIKRGAGTNLYTAQIRCDDSIKEGDEESYNMTIGLTGYEGIAGDNQNGPVVFLGNKVAYMSYNTMVWQIIGRDAPFDIDGIAGNNQFGPIIYSGNTVAYMDNYGTQQWTIVANAPFDIEGITGDNHSGPIIYSGNKVAYMNPVANNTWVQITEAPFEIDGIAGDNRLGVIIYSGSRVAYMQKYADNKWTELTMAPFEIEGIAGDNESGPIIYAGSQVSYMTRDLYPNGSWSSIEPAPFLIEGITGNNRQGCIVFYGSEAKYMNKYASGIWHDLAAIPFDTSTFTVDPKLQIRKSRN